MVTKDKYDNNGIDLSRIYNNHYLYTPNIGAHKSIKHILAYLKR